MAMNPPRARVTLAAWVQTTTKNVAKVGGLLRRRKRSSGWSCPLRKGHRSRHNRSPHAFL